MRIHRVMRNVLAAGACLTMSMLWGCGDDEGVTAPSGSATPTELEGSWIGYEEGESTQWTFTFTGNVVSGARSGVEQYRGTMILDTTTSPRRFTITITHSLYTAYIGTQGRIIYERNGTALRLAGNEPGNPDYPVSFTPTGQTRVWNLNRQ